MTHRVWIAISGFIWFFIGSMLLYKGLRLLEGSAIASQLIALGLLIGFFKGRFVLSKTVKRVVARIKELPLPIRLKDAYAKSYWILIGSMMALGMVFRFLPISTDIRGTIDITIGSALMNGAMLYFRSIYGTGFPAQSR